MLTDDLALELIELQVDGDFLVNSFVVLGVRGVADVIIIDLVAMRHIGVSLDGMRFLLTCVTEPELLLLVQHAVVVLANLVLVVRHIVPVDFASPHIHLGFIQAKMVGLVFRKLLAHNTRVILVPIMVRHSQII